MVSLVFPRDFLWGVATSAFQIEGALDAGGAGESDWRRWTHRSNTIANRDTAERACDHYHRWRQDVGLLKWLGVRLYRFSIAWERIQPTDGHSCSSKGLDFYKRLVDELLSANIIPMVTLHHFVNPAWIAELGAWLNPDTPKYFADFCSIVVKELGDRVRYWITINEPTAVCGGGYITGKFPPGEKNQTQHYFIAIINMLRGHSLAVRAIRATAPLLPRIGLARAHIYFEPFDPGESTDRRATQVTDYSFNRIVLEPLLTGEVPEPPVEIRHHFPAKVSRQITGLAKSLDYIGLNYYCRVRVRAPETGWETIGGKWVHTEDAQITAMNWEVYPPGIFNILMYYKGLLGDLPVFITENGYPTEMRPGEDTTEDDDRINYIATHLAQIHKAMMAGIDVLGYCYWSLMDNFEWAEGYRPRFGLFFVDFATQKRIPRKSAHFYRNLLKTGLLLEP
ncbi:family 1 glycosylhydrolase [Candidatus Sumerlaeota bacterium]|nr:family 1 glycosylhydrolase [Candidatus Sumerlaeota bacterium]